MPDIDIFIWPALAQQTFPRRRKPSPRRDDCNINILDSLATATHVSVWSSWSQAPPSRRALFAPRLWKKRYTFRNKGHYSDRVEELAYIPLPFLSYVAESLPRHGWWARRRALRMLLSSTSSTQQLVQTQAAATTSFPLGDVHWVGGVMTLGL